MFRQRKFRVHALVATFFLLAFGALLEVSPAEARRGGFGRGRGGIGIRVPSFGAGYYGYGFYGYPYGFYGYPYAYGPYRRPGQEGGLNPTQARLMGVGAIDMRVKPGKAEVWVDGTFLGSVRDFDGSPSYLWLKEGAHRITLYRGGFQTYEEEVMITPGAVIKLKLKLLPGESEPPSKGIVNPSAEGSPAAAESKTSA